MKAKTQSSLGFRWERSFLWLAMFVCIASNASAQPPDIIPQPTAEDRQLMESGRGFADQVSQQISAVEWLGPLAPIALSPFFGLACLSGIATYGPDWLQQRSGIFGASSPLNNPALFWTMVVLTIVTSLPRFSKVSKPLALAAEKLEAYSVIVIVIAMRMFGTADGAVASESISVATPVYLYAGIASMPLDLLLAAASAINILVINGVKLFCELVIWLTPIPLIDAVVEASNKALCIGLMSLYCWSPLAATIVNLILLAVCGCVYLWTQRRIVYYLDLIAGPLLVGWLPWWFGPNADGSIVFLGDGWNGLPKLSKLRLKGTIEGDWKLIRRRWYGSREIPLSSSDPKREIGLLAETLHFQESNGATIKLHKRHVDYGSAFGSPSISH